MTHSGRSHAERRRRGIFYTPAAVADALTARALDGVRPSATVCDPTVGEGAFLLAAAEVLARAGGDPERIVAEQLFGADLDEAAVRATRRALRDWTRRRTGLHAEVPESHLVCVDSLTEGAAAWPDRPGRGFDVILGNPPFGSQLRSRTARDRLRSTRLLERLGLGALGYVDDAALFLLEACELVAPEGRVCLILPLSVGVARDAEPVRVAVDERMSWHGIWVGGDVGFDAAVQVWAPILRRGAPPERVSRWVGPRVDPVPALDRVSPAASWAPRYADLLGGCDVDLEVEGRCDGHLGDLATATAGFRRQFYGLAPYVLEAGERGATRSRPALITTGSIDPLHERWATTKTRFAGRDLHRPVVDVAALRAVDPELARWVDARFVPKVLVAPQGSIVEAVPDHTGTRIPSTPVISVELREKSSSEFGVADLAALLSAPATSAHLHRVAAGSGLGPRSIRLSAQLLLSLPLPADRAAWDRAAALADEAATAAASGDRSPGGDALLGVAIAMNEAFGLDSDHQVTAWWTSRLPRHGR